MSTALPAAGVRSHRKSRAVPATTPLIWVRRIGYSVLGLQLAGMLIWSTLLYERFALTIDFAQYQQAWYLIAHGHLNPVSTVGRGYFWQNHSELIIWPLALLYWLWPHQVTLLWIQDLAVVGAELVAFTWLCELAQRQLSKRSAAGLASTGLVLLAINPWTWWAISFDFHAESLAILFAVLLARDLAAGRRRMWVWAVTLLTCGDVAGSYVIGFGIAAFVSGRGRRVTGIALACCGLAAVGLITVVHGNLGSPITGYASMFGIKASVTHPPSMMVLAKAAAAHPMDLLKPFWAKHLDIWANIGSAGIVGIAFIWTLPLFAVVLAANDLVPGLLFAMPSYQDLAIYLLMPVGSVFVLGYVLRRRPRIGVLLIALVLAQAIGIAAAWWPQLPVRWLRVSAPTAATLASVESRIPESAEVVASEGIVGRFSSHTYLEVLENPSTLPVHGQTWFVIAPNSGQEMQTTASAMALIAELAGPLHATLVVHGNNVWAFRWVPPSGVTSVTVPTNYAPLQAWTSPSAASRDVLAGPVTNWHLTSTNVRGYVVDGLQWQEKPGRYEANVSLSTTGPVNVEVWNDNCGSLLARHAIPATSGIRSVTLSVDATASCPAPIYSGWGPFSANFLPPPAGQRLEVRVWSPGGETVDVYRAALSATG